MSTIPLMLAASAAAAVAADLTYYDVAGSPGLQGTAFPSSSKLSPFDRFPKSAQGVVSESVWSLSRDSAGLFFMFETNSKSFVTNITYLYSDTEMWHFPSTGVAGMDLYRYDAEKASYRWVGTSRNNIYPHSTNVLIDGLPTTLGQYVLFLPTYNAPVQLHVGVDTGSTFHPTDLSALPEASKPPSVYHYGTSIQQGAVASRPGMAHLNLYAKNLGVIVYNFGFSGHGLMELSVAEQLVHGDPVPDAVVIDCLPNMTPEQVSARTIPLVNYLRANLTNGATVPIVLSEGTTYGQYWLGNGTGIHDVQSEKRAALLARFEELSRTDANLYYQRGDDLFSSALLEVSPTVGGTHPTDAGMTSMAAGWEDTLRPILGMESGNKPGNKRSLKDTLLGTPADHPNRVAARTTARPVAFGSSYSESTDPATIVPAGYATRAAYDQARESHSAILRDTVGSTDIDVVQGKLPRASARNSNGRKETVAADAKYVPMISLTMSGRGFVGTSGSGAPPSPFNRLPTDAAGVVPSEVESLSNMSTGVRIGFRTNSTTITVDYTLGLPAEPLWHMPVSGTAGMDLYRWDPLMGLWRFVSCVTSFPHAGDNQIKQTIAVGLPQQPDGSLSRYLLHMPLRNFPLGDAALGVDQDAAIEPDQAFPPLSKGGAIVWWGTSIDQGGVAARPGDTYTNIIARRTGRDVINLGFAGNGKMQPSVVPFIAAAVKEPGLIGIDCNPNLGPGSIANLTVPAVHSMRAHNQQDTPIVLAEGTTYGDTWIGGETQFQKRAALRAAYAQLVAAGDDKLHYVFGDNLFATHAADFRAATFTNPTVGGTHPSSLGHREVGYYYKDVLPNWCKDA